MSTNDTTVLCVPEKERYSGDFCDVPPRHTRETVRNASKISPSGFTLCAQLSSALNRDNLSRPAPVQSARFCRSILHGVSRLGLFDRGFARLTLRVTLVNVHSQPRVSTINEVAQY